MEPVAGTLKEHAELSVSKTFSDVIVSALISKVSISGSLLLIVASGGYVPHADLYTSRMSRLESI
jgi:hypothetical protein